MDGEYRTIGINIDLDENWFGGVNYLINIINSFNYLDENRKPHVIVFSSIQKKELINQINYSKVRFIFVEKKSFFLTFFKSILLRRNLFLHDEMNRCDCVFPFNNFPIKTSGKVKLISWIPDFQHKVLKKNFSITNWILRDIKFKLISIKTDKLILSSQSALKDYKLFYSKRCFNIGILPFTSVINEDYINHEILNRFNLKPKKYFIISNQFHIHKNFEFAIKSFVNFIKKNSDIKLVITGSASLSNNYYSEIKELVKNSGYESNIIFTGFITRNNVISLMYNSIALIQPSKFEGWNTAIEDCKTLDIPVIASSIPVHIEQLSNYGNYFDNNDSSSLEKILSNFGSLIKGNKEDNLQRFKNFANLILEKFES